MIKFLEALGCIFIIVIVFGGIAGIKHLYSKDHREATWSWKHEIAADVYCTTHRTAGVVTDRYLWSGEEWYEFVTGRRYVGGGLVVYSVRAPFLRSHAEEKTED